jgi:glycosyltransferase involved in cell wall biosynthesis
MNICLITSSFPANESDAAAAAGLFVKEFACALRDQGHGVSVLMPDKRAQPKEKIPGIEVCWFPWLGGAKRISYLNPINPLDALAMMSLFVQGARHGRRMIRRRSTDHLICLWAVPAGLLGRRLSRRTGVPYSVWCLGSDINRYGAHPLFRPIVRSVLRGSARIFANSRDLCEKAAALSGRACEFMTTMRKLPAPQSSESPLPHPRYLFLGRFSKEKGADIMIDAFMQYAAASGAGSLVMLGDGPLDAFVKERAATLAGRVEVAGFAPAQTVADHLAACDALVVSSRAESLPAVISEALQIGRPVIATDVGDCGRLIREFGVGLVVPREDPAALARALHEFERAPAGSYGAGIPNARGLFDISIVTRRIAESIRASRCGGNA